MRMRIRDLNITVDMRHAISVTFFSLVALFQASKPGVSQTEKPFFSLYDIYDRTKM